MVRSKKNAVLTRGGDEAVAGKSFYSSSAARPALKVLDTLMNTEASIIKVKEKRPAKPKSAAQLYAEDKCAEMAIQSGLSHSKLAIKSCKDDALTAFKNGEVEQEEVEKYTEKEKAERTDYERRVEQWNEQHQDAKLVISKNGTAVLSKTDAEGQKRKEKRSASKATKKKPDGPGTTNELQAISSRAAGKLKKLQTKKQAKVKTARNTNSDLNMLEDDDDEEEYSEEESDVEISENEDEDEEEEEGEEVEEEMQLPVKSKGKKEASSGKGSNQDAGLAKDKKGKPQASVRKRKAESTPDVEEQDHGTKASKQARSGTDKTCDPFPATEKLPASKKRGKKANERQAVADADSVAPSRKQTRASVKEQKLLAKEEPRAKRNKKATEKVTVQEGKTSKSKDAAKQEALPVKSRLSSKAGKPQNSKKHLGPTKPKNSPEKSNSAYTGDYDVPSDDE